MACQGSTGTSGGSPSPPTGLQTSESMRLKWQPVTLEEYKENFKAWRRNNTDMIREICSKGLPLKQIILNRKSSAGVQRLQRNRLRFKQLLFIAESSPQFHQDTKEKATGVMDIGDFDQSASIEKLSIENVFRLYASANKHDMQHQKEVCLELIKHHFSVETFVEILSLCFQYPGPHLFDLAVLFFNKNCMEISFREQFAAFCREDPAAVTVLQIMAMRQIDEMKAKRKNDKNFTDENGEDILTKQKSK